LRERQPSFERYGEDRDEMYEPGRYKKRVGHICSSARPLRIISRGYVNRCFGALMP
jgi:hypothetical protein